MLMLSFAARIPYDVVASLIESVFLNPGVDPNELFASMPLVAGLLLGAVVGPWIETAIFQWAVVRLLRGVLSWSWPAVILVSSCLFAAGHPYSVDYVISTFFGGIVLTYGYALKSEPPANAFLSIWLVHGLSNGVVLLLDRFDA